MSPTDGAHSLDVVSIDLRNQLKCGFDLNDDNPLQTFAIANVHEQHVCLMMTQPGHVHM